MSVMAQYLSRLTTANLEDTEAEATDMALVLIFKVEKVMRCLEVDQTTPFNPTCKRGTCSGGETDTRNQKNHRIT